MTLQASEVTFPKLHGGASHVALVFPELIMDMEAHAPNSSGSSGEATDGSDSGGYFSSTGGPMHHQVPKSSVRCAPKYYSGHTNVPAVMSWNFSGASAQPASDGTLEVAAAAAGKPQEQPLKRSASSAKSNAAAAAYTSASFAQDHIMAERKRREKISQRFIELSTVIPGLKKMDKATILSDATRHVKQLQEKVKALELEAAAAGGSKSVVGTVVLVKKPCYGAAGDDHGSPSSASSGSSPAARKRNPLPAEIEVRFSEKSVMMVRILCDDAKGVVVRVLLELEEGLHC